MASKVPPKKKSNNARPKRKSTAPRARKTAPHVEGFGAPAKGPELVISGDVTSPDPELCALSFADRWTMLRRAAHALGLSHVDHLWSLALEHSQLCEMGRVERWHCLGRAAKALDLSQLDRLWMLELEYSSLARQDREHPQAADTLAIARILKATILALKGEDQAWFEEQANRAKAYLNSHDAELVETRPNVADRLRSLMTEHLRKGATYKDAPQLADALLRYLFVDFRQSCLPVIADIPDAPTAEEVNQARRAALAGRPQLPDRFFEADLEEHNRRCAAFVAEVLRRDPGAFWPASPGRCGSPSMRARCEAASKRMVRVLLDTPPLTAHQKTAEDLVRAGLRAVGYPEKKVQSLFAPPSIN